MTDVIQCNSCGSSNQLPNARKSMFCAFCGGVIEKKIPQEAQQNKVYPKIISKGKREIPFKDTEWYKDKMIKIKASISISRKYGLNSNIVKNIEGYRTNEGYNTVIVYESTDGFTQGRRETEFTPFEYDYNDYESNLDLSSMNIKSFNDIEHHYNIEEINRLTSLNLDNNQIPNWDGIMEFKMLYKLSLKNNLIQNYPEKLPMREFYVALKDIDLSDNKLEKYPTKIDKFDYKNTTINLSNNSIDWDEIPESIISSHVFEDGRIAPWKYKLSLSENKTLTFDYIMTDEEKKRFEETKTIIDSPSSGKCFIATASMGSYNHPKVMELRNFRDNWILKQPWGNSFVEKYYFYGEKLSKKIEPSYLLKKLSYYAIVKPLVIISRIILK